MMTKKVFHVITQMEAGGAQGAAIRNSREMRARGFDSTVVFLYTKRPVYVNEPNVISLLEHKPSSAIDVFRILSRLMRIFRNDRTAIVMAYTHYANVIAAIAGRLSGISTIVPSHRNPVETYPAGCRALDRLIGTLGGYTKCITVSETVYSSFAKHPARYRQRLKLVRNGVDLRGHVDSKNGSDLRDHLAGAPYRFVTAGRLHPQKNQRTIIEAMTQVDGAELIIAGEGELREEFEQLIADSGLSTKVKLIGEIPPNEICGFLQNSDTFLFPSNYEAFGFSVVEAMAEGCPIICSDIPAMQEIVSDAGLRIATRDVNAWAASMKRVMADSDLRNAMRAKSTARAQLFSLEEMVTGYLSAAGLAPNNPAPIR